MVSIRRLVRARRKSPSLDAFRYREEIYRYVFARIDHVEEAEDITMDVIHSAESYPDSENLKTYMIGIARHKVTDHYRRKSKREVHASEEGVYDLAGSDEFLRIQMVLQRLADNYQECLVLKYVCGFSSEEIGQMLSLNAGAVDSTLQRARKAFASEWNQLNGEESE